MSNVPARADKRDHSQVRAQHGVTQITERLRHDGEVTIVTWARECHNVSDVMMTGRRHSVSRSGGEARMAGARGESHLDCLDTPTTSDTSLKSLSRLGLSM